MPTGLGLTYSEFACVAGRRTHLVEGPRCSLPRSVRTPRTDQLAARYAGTTRMGKKLAAALTEGSVTYEQATSQAVYRHILPIPSNFPMESVSRRPISPCCSATTCGDWRCRARVSACRVRSASRPTDSALKHEGPGRSLSLWG